jgi:uncharacterized protein (DUF924 family)
MWSAAALAAIALLACASQQLSVAYDPDEDFSALRTFAWFPRETKIQAELAARYPKQYAAADRTIEKKLREKGYSNAARGAADFLVLYHLSLERKLDTTTINAPYTGGTSEWEVHRTVPTEQVVEYAEGTLVIDVLDNRTRRLVWRGTARGRHDNVPQAHYVEQRVSEVLDRFPPPASGR